MRSRVTRVPIIVVAALCAGALAIGCGDSGGEDVSGGALGAALDEASTTGEGPAYFAWVDTARLRELADLSSTGEEALSDQRWSIPIGLAFGQDLVGLVPSTDLGFDPLAGDRTIAVGSPPDDATRYDGVDVDGGTAAFEKFGFETRDTDSGEFLALGGEGEVVTGTGDDLGSGPPVGINRVAVEGDSLAIGAFEAPVAAALGRSGEPLADDPAFAAMAGCLGETSFAAMVTDPEEMAADEVALAGVGLAEPGSGSEAVPEIVCATAPDGSLDATAQTMERGFNGGGIDPVSSRPFDQELGEATIERGDVDGAPWVRATFLPPASGEQVGFVFNVLQQAALAGPLGGSSPLTPLE